MPLGSRSLELQLCLNDSMSAIAHKNCSFFLWSPCQSRSVGCYCHDCPAVSRPSGRDPNPPAGLHVLRSSFSHSTKKAHLDPTAVFRFVAGHVASVDSPHAHFLAHGIDAVTLRGIETGTAALDPVVVGSTIESLLRSLNSMVTPFHLSSFLHIPASASKLIPFCLLSALSLNSLT